MELSEEQQKVLEEILSERTQYNKLKEENKEIEVGKQIEWYAAVINANINTRFELDRQLLTISSAAIGVLVSFMNDIKTLVLFCFWGLSGICFLMTVILALNIFKNNRYVLEGHLQGINTRIIDDSLKNKDILMRFCFILGIVSLIVLALLKLQIFSY